MAHGVFVDGVWHTEWYDTLPPAGRLVPTAPIYRNWVTPDGSAGLSGAGGFAAEPRRCHLYVSLACPPIARLSSAS
jgi:putative glutathione S-transferase